MKYDLEAALSAYIEAIKNKDVDATIELLYEGIYKLAPKDFIVNQLKQSIINESILDYLKDFSIHNVSEIFEIDHISFSKVEYYLEMHIDRSEDILTKIMNDAVVDYEEHNQEMKSQIDIMLHILYTVYGKEHVKYDADEDCFRIWQLNTMLAINEDGAWKFVRWMPGSVYKRIFPKATVKKLATRFFLLD